MQNYKQLVLDRVWDLVYWDLAFACHLVLGICDFSSKVWKRIAR